MRQGLGAGALAAAMMAVVSVAVGASPRLTGSPFDAASSRLSLFHQALIYAKEGSVKLIDGRWNLSQSESKLGIRLSAAEREQLMACTGQILCRTPDIRTEDEDRVGVKVAASAVSVLRPDLLVTAKHVYFEGKRAVVPFGACSFRSYSRRTTAIPVLVEPDQRKGYVFNNEDFIVLRLKRALKGCNAFALDDADASLREGEPVLSVTGQQRRTLNRLSNKEPVIAKGRIRRVLDGVLGGPQFYYADIDFDVGGSGGAVFALKDRRPRFPHADRPLPAPVVDAEGRLVLRGISVSYSPQARNGRPYSDERNYTILVGLQAEFSELVKGKAQPPAAVEPMPCLEGGAAKIDVLSASVPPPEPETLAPSLQHYACGPDRKSRKARADCAKLAKGMQLAASQRAEAKQEFTLQNPTGCLICFSYNRCNNYGCWDQAVRLAGNSTLLAGLSERPPVIKNPQFCAAEPEVKFLAAKEKAKREGAHALTSEDIRGLDLDQIRDLRGY